MCDCPDDRPYKPNKYTRYIDINDYVKLVRGELSEVAVHDPGFINEPGEQPRKSNQ